MAKYQKRNSGALQPIPRIVDNTDAMAIKQLVLEKSRRPIRTDKGVVDPLRVPEYPAP